MKREFYTVDFQGFEAKLPVLPLPSGVSIAFFNLHGDSALTEHCAKLLTEKLRDCEVLITAESKGLQLTHCIARNLGQRFYAVARKSKKLYMQDGIEVAIESSITTGKEQKLYLSRHDVELIRGKKVGIVDDVVSTGASLAGLVSLVEKAGGIVTKQAFPRGRRRGKASRRHLSEYYSRLYRLNFIKFVPSRICGRAHFIYFQSDKGSPSASV